MHMQLLVHMSLLLFLCVRGVRLAPGPVAWLVIAACSMHLANLVLYHAIDTAGMDDSWASLEAATSCTPDIYLDREPEFFKSGADNMQGISVTQSLQGAGASIWKSIFCPCIRVGNLLGKTVRVCVLGNCAKKPTRLFQTRVC